MKITLKLYASLSDYLPTEARKLNAIELELAAGTTIAQVIERQNLPPKSCHLVLIDGVFVPPAERAARPLAEGETLAIWPPIAGG
ncbi:MAG: MoaD/ThiS family protein [Betaproteobacteria bacterium]|nr:MAG: MoaD/ThiS family protein [Betaproteobacteria bacterium]